MPNVTLTLSESVIPAVIKALQAQRDEINEQIKALGNRVGNGLLGNGLLGGRKGKKRGIKATTGPGDGTGNAKTGRKRGPKPKAKKGGYKDITKPQLLSLLSGNKGTVSRKILNAAGFNLISALQIAKDEPAKLKFTKNGAHGTVSLK